jgi:predicted metal-dependent peptidase
MIAKTAIDLLIEEPFFGHFLTHFKKEMSEKTETVAISVDVQNDLTILINPNYWKNTLYQSDLKIGELKHQLLHLVFGHLNRSKAYQNDDLFGVASDLTINQFIENSQLTFDAITLKEFSDVDLPPNKTVDFYYKRFLEILIEPEYGNTNARQFLQKTLTEGHQKLKQHSLWGNQKTVTNSEQKITEQKVLNALQTAWQRYKRSNKIGDLPRGLETQIERQIERLKPSLNWKRVLRLFTAKSRKTKIKNTIRRPSKRYGTSPGIKIQKRQKILVAIDTSASVSADLQAQFFDEIFHIWRQGAKIHIVECDVEIQRGYEYLGKTPEMTKGEGGTNFNAPIAFANSTYLPDAVIYFTDGKGETPTVRSRFPILWIVADSSFQSVVASWQLTVDR